MPTFNFLHFAALLHRLRKLGGRFSILMRSYESCLGDQDDQYDEDDALEEGADMGASLAWDDAVDSVATESPKGFSVHGLIFLLWGARPSLAAQ